MNEFIYVFYVLIIVLLFAVSWLSVFEILSIKYKETGNAIYVFLFIFFVICTISAFTVAAVWLADSYGLIVR